MAKAKALPKGVIGYKEFFDKLLNHPDSLGLILLYGQEQYLIDGALKTAKKKYITEGAEDIDYSIIDTRSDDQFSFDRLDEMVSMPPMMSDRRLVIIRQSGITGKEVGDKELDILKNIPSSSVVIFVEDEADAKRKIFKSFVQNGTVVQMSAMEEDDISGRVARMLAKYNLTIDGRASMSLISRCGGGMLAISGEVAKIALYCQNAGFNRVTEEIIEDCCPPDLSGRIFDIMDACGGKDPAKALGTLNNLIAMREPVIQIRVQVLNHLKRLIMAKEAGDSRTLVTEAGMNEYYAGKLVRQAQSFSMNRLISTYLSACASDSDVKHGLIDERYALEIILVKAATGDR